MLSKRELEFLKGEIEVNKGYERFLRHSISKKLKRFEEEILPALMSNEVTRKWLISLADRIVRGSSNGVRESSNALVKFNRNLTVLEGVNEGDPCNESPSSGGCGLAWSRLPASGAGDRRFKSGQPHHFIEVR